MRFALSSSAVALTITFAATSLFAAGVEFPDNGVRASGRGAAWAANPDDYMAFQYNPAGLAQQEGLRFGAGARVVNQALTFKPANGANSISNSGGPFLLPAGALSYGMGKVGPLSGLTFLLGGTGPSAVGVSEYPKDGTQRYMLIDSDYFIAYGSAAVSASWQNLVSFGVTAQLVQGHAKFSKAVTAIGGSTDANYMSISSVDTKSGFIPTGVIGLSVTPTDTLAFGLSYRPHFNFEADGTIDIEFPTIAAALGTQVHGNDITLVLPMPDVIRAGVQYRPMSHFDIELDFVYETWSRFESLDILTHDITVQTGDVIVPLEDIVLEKNFRDAWSVRLGGDYELMADLLVVRAGYIYESSAIPKKSVSVDFANWGRNTFSLGGSVAMYGAWLDVFYAYHLIPEQVTHDTRNIQTVSPCSYQPHLCSTTAPIDTGSGTYTASQQVFGLAVRVPFDDLRGEL